ncbi:conserved hypothetical protein [Shewanella halifaxensis HAW-EB4]|uniref:RanBP2-type domain-containing protein n=1 Tax=Shewanella halifaxensis (strain HAW-EB4) TaxID=458817 RepID=B0TS83_SHEHH|nr:hypothetical protein [Shewanella halifaxensis]ABZ75218.1 conserved hypothetical protein [Shewanella halifaxensis HAW-EB4]
MAWKCQNCSTEIEETSFEVCWNCGCERGQEKLSESQSQVLECLRCESPMIKLGSKEFHEGTRWGALGNIGELFVDKQALDMYACESCGKVEFFLPGAGDS